MNARSPGSTEEPSTDILWERWSWPREVERLAGPMHSLRSDYSLAAFPFNFRCLALHGRVNLSNLIEMSSNSRQNWHGPMVHSHQQPDPLRGPSVFMQLIFRLSAVAWCCPVNSCVLSGIGKLTKRRRVHREAVLHEVEGQRVTKVRAVDSDVGSSSEDLRRLFQADVQPDRTSNWHQDGAGLELPLRMKFAQVRGGTTTVASASAKGSANAPALPENPHERPHSDRGGRRRQP